MGSARRVRLTEGMSLEDIQGEINKLGEFRTPPSQYHTMENGQEVIYVKKSGPQDRLKRLVMSDDMRADEARPLCNLILQACKKIDVDDTDGRYRNIRQALITGNENFASDLKDLVAIEVMKKM
jgi:hypothetical protein